MRRSPRAGALGQHLKQDQFQTQRLRHRGGHIDAVLQAKSEKSRMKCRNFATFQQGQQGRTRDAAADMNRQAKGAQLLDDIDDYVVHLCVADLQAQGGRQITAADVDKVEAARLWNRKNFRQKRNGLARFQIEGSFNPAAIGPERPGR